MAIFRRVDHLDVQGMVTPRLASTGLGKAQPTFLRRRPLPGGNVNNRDR